MRRLRLLASPLSLLVAGGLWLPIGAAAQSAWYLGASGGQSAIKASAGEAEFTGGITRTGATRVSRTERRTDANFGIGLQWGFSPSLAARLELERFRRVGRQIGGREGRDVDLASLGIVFKF